MIIRIIGVSIHDREIWGDRKICSNYMIIRVIEVRITRVQLYKEQEEEEEEIITLWQDVKNNTFALSPKCISTVIEILEISHRVVSEVVSILSSLLSKLDDVQLTLTSSTITRLLYCAQNQDN